MVRMQLPPSPAREVARQGRSLLQQGYEEAARVLQVGQQAHAALQVHGRGLLRRRGEVRGNNVLLGATHVRAGGQGRGGRGVGRPLLRQRGGVVSVGVGVE